MMPNEQFEKARDRAFRYLGRAARTRREMLNKLDEWETDADTRDAVMDMLEGYGYIDDAKYAKNYAEDCVRLKGFGKPRIRQALWEKGIDDETIQDALAGLALDEAAMAKNHIIKRMKDKPIVSDDERRRLMDYLLRRGISAECARRAVAEYIREA